MSSTQFSLAKYGGCPENHHMNSQQFVDSEIRGLHTIRMRSLSKINGPEFSPIENIDGSNQVIGLILDLRDSPLCWPITQGIGESLGVDELLDDLEVFYEQATQPWNDLRSVQPPSSYMTVWCTSPGDIDVTAPPVWERWPNGTFPASVQSQAKECYWQLKSNSRFSVEDMPSKWDLDFACPSVTPLTFAHTAGLAAIVCIGRALERLNSFLLEWLDDAQIVWLGQNVAWMTEHEPDALERLRVAGTGLAVGRYENSPVLRAKELMQSAKAWLNLVEHDYMYQAATNGTAENVEAQVLSRLKVERSAKAKAAAKGYRGRGKVVTFEMVARYFRARPNDKHEVIVAACAVAMDISERTVERRYKEAKEANLLS